MTNSEQKSVDSLYKLLSEMRTENGKFREDLGKRVESCEQRQKLAPVRANPTTFDSITNA
jgi:hypothetical protein